MPTPSSSFDGALVPYRAGSSTSPSTALTTHSLSTSLLPTRLFTAQTGHAIATELVYRLLFDLLNRLLAHLHRFASRQLDHVSAFLERSWNERADALKAAREARKRSGEEGTKKTLGIADEVGRVARERGFLACDSVGDAACPVTGEGRGRRGPPGWVGFVLKGIEEGRIVERDFWGGNTFQI